MYYLFYGEIYYPDGGVRDFKGKFATIEEAKLAHAAVADTDWGNWAHIANENMEIVSEWSYKTWHKEEGWYDTAAL
jgi:hypothetical protein